MSYYDIWEKTTRQISYKLPNMYPTLGKYCTDYLTPLIFNLILTINRTDNLKSLNPILTLAIKPDRGSPTWASGRKLQGKYHTWDKSPQKYHSSVKTTR